MSGDDPGLTGRYIEVRATLRTDDPAISPVLSDLRIRAAGDAGGNHPPAAIDDQLTTAQDTAGDVNVLANDSDPDVGDTLEVSGSTDGTHGSVSCAAAGVCTYTPDTGVTGSDSFTYTVSDGHDGTDEGVVDVTVQAAPPENRPPVAVDDELTTAEDTSGNVNVLANDSDPDVGDVLEVTASTDGASGTVSCTPAGVCTYTPQSDFHGSDTFTYTISDDNGETDQASVNVTVTQPDAAPNAVDDTITTDEGQAGSVNVLSNDTDPNGDALSVTTLSPTATHGTVACAATGLCTYTPDAGFHGTDSFAYSISDGQGGSANANVSVTVNEVNQPPVAVDDDLTAQEDGSGSVDVLANDSDPDGDQLEVTTLSPTAAHGTVACTSDGFCTYIPEADFNGTDAFNYSVTDGLGGTSTATVHVVVTPENDPPVLTVTGSPAAAQYSDPVTIELSATDIDGDAFAFSATGLPAGLTLTDHGDGTATISGDITEMAASYQASVTVSDGNETATATAIFQVREEDATLTYVGDMLVSTTGAERKRPPRGAGDAAGRRSSGRPDEGGAHLRALLEQQYGPGDPRRRDRSDHDECHRASPRLPPSSASTSGRLS